MQIACQNTSIKLQIRNLIEVRTTKTLCLLTALDKVGSTLEMLFFEPFC